MKRIFILPLMLLSLVSYGQVITVKGTVTDAETGDPVSFAHVGICERSIGTVANEAGEFVFNIPEYILSDTLCASAIGYETFRYGVRDLASMTTFDIDLVPQTNILSELVIRDERVTGRRIVEKAIKRINKNYYQRPYVLEGYYRDYLKKNNEYINFLEAAMATMDPGIKKPVGKSSIYISQMRYSKSYPKSFKEYVSDLGSDTTKILIHGVLPSFEGNEFLNMQFHNPIRNYHSSVPFIGLFETFYESNYQFDIEYYTYLDDKEVVMINIAPGENFKFTHVGVEGKIFIRTEDYAIVKFSYAYFVTKNLDTKKWFELKLEYREHEGQMFLKYISFMNYFKLMTVEEIADFYLYREFFVNNINLDKLGKDDYENLVDPGRPLYLHDVPNDPQFWINYNRTLLEQPLLD